jgi:1-phosphatidylinositol phosphodiesterase
MSIPGTHQTCARRLGAAFVCQALSLASQLRAGIRFLDIRCRHYKTGMPIHHAANYQGYWFDKKFQFEDMADPCVLDDCIAFLRAHPRECIIMSIRMELPWYREDAADAAANGGEWFSDCVCKSIEHTRDFWFDPATLGAPERPPPLLGMVRGKIVLVRGFLDNFRATWPDEVRTRARGWQRDGAVLHEQDEYRVYSWSLGAKFNWIAKTSDRARGLNLWYSNFTSGSEGLAPSDVAKAINPRVAGYLDLCRPTSGPDGVGMLAMDFPGDGLIQKVVALNSAPQPPVRTTLWLADEFGGISRPAGEDNHVSILPGRSLGGLEVKYQDGYGLVNLRLFDSTGRVFVPIRQWSDGRYGGGWMCPDFDGDAPVRVNGPINGIQFAKHEKWGIVNARVHLRGKPEEAWEPWLTRAETDATAECVSEPRVLNGAQTVFWLNTWREGGKGIVDGRIAYA